MRPCTTSDYTSMKIEKKYGASYSTIYTEQYPQKRQDSAQQSTLVLLGDIAAFLMLGVLILVLFEMVFGGRKYILQFSFLLHQY